MIILRSPLYPFTIVFMIRVVLIKFYVRLEINYLLDKKQPNRYTIYTI